MTAKNIRDDYGVLANLTEISCTRIKVCVQYAGHIYPLPSLNLLT